jgi:gamma-glutamylcysteine synthetase
VLALFYRLLAHVPAVDLDQVERADRRDVAATVVADELENSKALAVADDSLSIDRTRVHRQRRDGRRSQPSGKRARPVAADPAQSRFLPFQGN